MDNRQFYERRLLEELTRSQRETEPHVRALHREWALLYRGRLEALGIGVAIAA